jgi:pimeloyl-ACP methyl ester carboxylesterase
MMSTATVLVRAAPIVEGASSIVFEDARGNADRPITAWTYRPRELSSSAPVVFVMHGKGRNGREYRDSWIELAERNRFLLLTPEFSDEAYPSEEMYQWGFVKSSDGKLRDRQKWSFMAIEHLFDEVVRDNGLAAKRYFIYGHSGGGQFVHRLAMLCPEARFELAIAANPGWYTMPDLTIDYPYGLRGTPAGAAQLRAALARPLVILLGDRTRTQIIRRCVEHLRRCCRVPTGLSAATPFSSVRRKRRISWERSSIGK